MSFKCGLFDSTEIIEVVGGYPRGNKAQDAAFFARMLKNIIGNGIPPNPTTNFQVLAQSGFTVQMRPGDIYLKGYFGYDDEVSTFLITENLRAAPVYISCRYDAVTKDLYWVMSDAVERSETYYDLAVARIVIPSGAVEITDVMITDLRSDPAYCGYVQKITDTVAEELREEKLSKSEALDLMHPIGDIVMRLDNIDPGEIFGGTWERVLQGRTPIGFDPYDSDFEVVGKTLGSKTASYSLENDGYAKIGGYANQPVVLRYTNKKGTGIEYIADTHATFSQGAALGPIGEPYTQTRAMALGGTTDEGNNMQPSIVCCFWIRVA